MAFWICAALCAPASADDWTSGDLQREAAFFLLQLTDYAQTQNIAHHCNTPGSWYEQNSVLGRCPDPGNVSRYFALTTGAQILVANLLPGSLRRDFQNITIGIEFGAVSNNFSLGISASF